ncbi:MAG: class I SAM-dependent methyltransferase [SAR202 cluster bacterium]|nr:class I SAM-dependent methyltransferase [SAR202 cluster bacterium]
MRHHGHGQRGASPPNDEVRRQWQDPDAVLFSIGLRAGHTFVDLGCGRGFFALPAAARVGERGHVFGVDINAEAIATLVEAAKEQRLGNLTGLVGEAETTQVCDGCADVVFIGIALHDFRDPVQALRNAKGMLKPGGRLVNLDWKKQETPYGPPQEIRFDEAKAVSLIEQAGLRVTEVRNSGVYHYTVTAERG